MSNETSNLGLDDIFKLREKNARATISTNNASDDSGNMVNPGIELECIRTDYNQNASLKDRIDRYNVLKKKLHSKEANQKLSEIRETLKKEYQEVYDYSQMSTADLTVKKLLYFIVGAVIAGISFLFFVGAIKIIGIIIGLAFIGPSGELGEKIKKIATSILDIKNLDKIL